jgi:hypothetical protein
MSTNASIMINDIVLDGTGLRLLTTLRSPPMGLIDSDCSNYLHEVNYKI